MVRSESARLYSLCFRLTGNAPDAEDLSQDTFTRAYRGFGRFEGRSKLSTWLYRIAVNAWKNKLRSKNKLVLFGLFQKNDEGSEDEAAPLDPKGNDPSPEVPLERLESDQLLQRGLLSLGREDREIIVLRDLEDKSYDELSEILGIPLGTVKSRLARARESLRIKLTPALRQRGELI